MTTFAPHHNQNVAQLFDDMAERFDDSSNHYAVHRRVEALAAEADGSCLEIGGGTGALAAHLGPRLPIFHSDISPKMCQTTRRRFGCPSVCFDAEAIPVASRSFDTVVASEMIYYLAHLDRFVAEAHRVLHPSGRLLISTTNPAAWPLEQGRKLLRKLGVKRMFFDDGSPRLIPLRRLTAKLERAGFTVERTRKIIILPFAFLDPINRMLERTFLRHLGLFMIVITRKRSADS